MSNPGKQNFSAAMEKEEHWWAITQYAGDLAVADMSPVLKVRNSTLLHTYIRIQQNSTDPD